MTAPCLVLVKIIQICTFDILNTQIHDRSWLSTGQFIQIATFDILTHRYMTAPGLVLVKSYK